MRGRRGIKRGVESKYRELDLSQLFIHTSTLRRLSLEGARLKVPYPASRSSIPDFFQWLRLSACDIPNAETLKNLLASLVPRIAQYQNAGFERLELLDCPNLLVYKGFLESVIPAVRLEWKEVAGDIGAMY